MEKEKRRTIIWTIVTFVGVLAYLALLAQAVGRGWVGSVRIADSETYVLRPWRYLFHTGVWIALQVLPFFLVRAIEKLCITKHKIAYLFFGVTLPAFLMIVPMLYVYGGATMGGSISMNIWVMNIVTFGYSAALVLLVLSILQIFLEGIFFLGRTRKERGEALPRQEGRAHRFPKDDSMFRPKE
ncbi:hypothetical protein LJC20_06845 [Eubacteriales bacterium OttesenSCG-928-M02]|nr:hypothetical protein [Eubacteriales bacterium OttesenSCG-928-M02]